MGQLVLELASETAPIRSAVCPVCKATYEPYARRKAAQKTSGASACRAELWRRYRLRQDGKRATKAQRMLARLREGPATTLELMAVGGSGWRSRLQEVRDGRADGECHEVRGESHGDWWVYTLEG